MGRIFLKYINPERVIIMASHLREDIEVLCDEVYRMTRGKMIKIVK